MSTTLITPAEITETTKLGDVLETEVCGRCGGSGHYSYNQIDGTMCYGCNGSGRRYTKRGKATRAYWEYLLEAPVEAIREGDRVYDRQMGWATVKAVEVTEDGRSASGVYPARDPERLARLEADPHYRIEPSDREDMVWARYIGPEYNVKTTKVGMMGMRPESKMLVNDRTIHVPLLKALATYQASLTKAGKPRKQRAAA